MVVDLCAVPRIRAAVPPAHPNPCLAKGRIVALFSPHPILFGFIVLHLYQIPPCPEQGAALAQLDRDGGSDADKLAAFDFEVRQASSAAEETENSSNSGEGGDGRTVFGVAPFFSPCGPLRALGTENGELDFSVRAPTTSKNLYRVLRALQVRSPRWRDRYDWMLLVSRSRLTLCCRRAGCCPHCGFACLPEHWYRCLDPVECVCVVARVVTHLLLGTFLDTVDASPPPV